MRRLLILVIVGVLILQTACSEQSTAGQERASEYTVEVPSHFPKMVIPEDNPITQAKVDLGRRLFFDPTLSVDSSVSCASCHHPNKAFSDVVALSEGAQGQVTERNSPSLMNVAFHPILMREGAVPTLELQVLSPLEGETEMAHNLVEVCGQLNSNESYVRAFQEVFQKEVTPFTLTRAIAAYERTLIGGDARYDDYILGDSAALSAAEIRGMELFNSSKLNCISCHSGVLFTSFEITNNGLYSESVDPGLYRLTLDEKDLGKFKIPSLRNVQLSAPYMHDGSLNSLEDVVDHYASGGKGHPNQSELITGFTIDENQKADLIAFMEALTERSATGAP